MREVAFHMTEFLAQSGELKGVVEYAEMFASMAGEFVDLRATPAHPCLEPRPGRSAIRAGNALADAARAQGLNGVIYPSVRAAGGTCIVALWPHVVQSVAPGGVYRFEWSGADREPVESPARVRVATDRPAVAAAFGSSRPARRPRASALLPAARLGADGERPAGKALGGTACRIAPICG